MPDITDTTEPSARPTSPWGGVVAVIAMLILMRHVWSGLTSVLEAPSSHLLIYAAAIPFALVSGLIAFALPEDYGGATKRLLRTAGMTTGALIALNTLLSCMDLFSHPGGDSWGLFGVLLSLMVYTGMLIVPLGLSWAIIAFSLRPPGGWWDWLGGARQA